MSARVCNYSQFLWWLQRTSVYTNKDCPLLHLTQLFSNVEDKQANTTLRTCTVHVCMCACEVCFFNPAYFVVKKEQTSF